MQRAFNPGDILAHGRDSIPDGGGSRVDCGHRSGDGGCRYGPDVLYDAALNSLPQAQGWAGPIGPAVVGVAGGTLILSGAMRDYSASAVPVYATYSFMFFGDETSSARAAARIGQVTISPVPEPGILGLMLAGFCLAGLAVRKAGAKT